MLICIFTGHKAQNIVFVTHRSLCIIACTRGVIVPATSVDYIQSSLGKEVAHHTVQTSPGLKSGLNFPEIHRFFFFFTNYLYKRVIQEVMRTHP